MEKLRKSFRKLRRNKNNLDDITNKSPEHDIANNRNPYPPPQITSPGGTDTKSSSTTATSSPDKVAPVVPSLIRFQDDLQPIDTEKSLQHQNDEKMVRKGLANFKVRYIGCIEVKDARGMSVCEDAVVELKKLSKKKPKKVDSKPASGKSSRANTVSEVTAVRNPDDTIAKVTSELKNVTKLAEKSIVVEQKVEKRSILARMSFRKKKPKNFDPLETADSRSRTETDASMIKKEDRKESVPVPTEPVDATPAKPEKSGSKSKKSKSKDNKSSLPTSDLFANLDSTMATTITGRKYKIVDQKAVIWISPDSLRVVDKNKNLLIDQTIEKVSFCAPDSNHVKAFSYICRDGALRKWWCYSFTTRKNIKGDRLSHAVGCAFNACLTRKLTLEKIAKEEAENNKSQIPESGSNDTLDNEVATLTAKNSPKKLQKMQSFANADLEKTRQSIDQKHPELRQSMRKRPKAKNLNKDLKIQMPIPSFDSGINSLTTPASAQASANANALNSSLPISTTPNTTLNNIHERSFQEEPEISAHNNHNFKEASIDAVLKPLSSIEDILNGTADAHSESTHHTKSEILLPESKNLNPFSQELQQSTQQPSEFNPWESTNQNLGLSNINPVSQTTNQQVKLNLYDSKSSGISEINSQNLNQSVNIKPSTSRFDPSNPFYDHSKHYKPTLR